MTHPAFAEIGDDAIESIRAFNRFYTNRIGALDRAFMDTPYTLTEARVIYELAAQGTTSASKLADELSLDPAYLSRIIKSFADAGLVETRRDPEDGRGRLLALTLRGRGTATDLAQRSRQRIATLLSSLDGDARRDLAGAMERVRALLSDISEPIPVSIRPHRVGDIAFIVHRQARLYAEEYGWNGEYEALASIIAGNFLKDFKPGREYCWVAERNGVIAGSVFLVEGGKEVAKLRLLYVEPSARGLGLGRTLVRKCIDFARDAGYSRLELWTNDVLTAARTVYQTEGFSLTAEERHHSFGKDLNGQTWSLEL